jgi:UDP-N-acetylmuramoyl-L-alanyl-D-glutamate--2,6-diaminopimelate ligase
MKTLNKIKSLIRSLTPKTLISFYHWLWSFGGAIRYHFPSRELKVIGVTGTSGKSTVVELTAHILREDGYRVASASSIRFQVADQVEENRLKMTMPGRGAMQRFLYQAKQAQCQYAVIEVTSEGISQHRHKFIDFDALVFTCLSPEHIERHGSFDNYRQTKGRLFAQLAKSRKNNRTIIANVNDPQAPYFLSFKSDRRIGFGRESNNSVDQGIYLEEMSLSAKGGRFVFNGQLVEWSLWGEFNVFNGLAAAATAWSQGVSLSKSAQILSCTKGIPGRMETVLDDPFRVIVDYAHTPKSLEFVYQTVEHNIEGRLLVVLGACGGGRDKWKRLVFGQLAAKYAQVVILTNEDPYDEDPMQIIEQVRSGIPKDFSGQLLIIADRRMAIQKALQLAKPKDAVVITGKGSENLMCWQNGQKIPWDDRAVVRKELASLKT